VKAIRPVRLVFLYLTNSVFEKIVILQYASALGMRLLLKSLDEALVSDILFSFPYTLASLPQSLIFFGFSYYIAFKIEEVLHAVSNTYSFLTIATIGIIIQTDLHKYSSSY
jgi:hypothetical protein